MPPAEHRTRRLRRVQFHLFATSQLVTGCTTESQGCLLVSQMWPAHLGWQSSNVLSASSFGSLDRHWDESTCSLPWYVRLPANCDWTSGTTQPASTATAPASINRHSTSHCAHAVASPVGTTTQPIFGYFDAPPTEVRTGRLQGVGLGFLAGVAPGIRSTLSPSGPLSTSRYEAG